MQFWMRARRIGVALAAGLALAGVGIGVQATPARAQAAPAGATDAEPVAVSSYSYRSEQGDWVGGGGSGSYGSVTVNNNVVDPSPEKIVLSTSFWTIKLAAPRGEPLRPGVFRDAERVSVRSGRAPGLDATGFDRGCNEVFGGFTVNQIEFDASGLATLVDLTFTQRCESADAPALTGDIKYRAFPLSYAYTSEAGDYIGGGTSNSYTGATSLFRLTGSADGIVGYTGSGQRETWSVRFAAPEGEQLQAGRTYQTADIGDETAAFLSVSHGSRGCGVSTGELTITRLAIDGQGKVKALAATFLQRCEGTTAALHGTIHYYA
ncbi:hypothetical protein ACFVT1_27925 [Streptomyces sp. NPDC057963]|uniref:hypothetical protein n=1 Tax=Streptomyces sp. NPDC057963 TaxID=3346290 RepID=UPI0036E8D835